MAGKTFPESVIKSLQEVVIGQSDVTIDAVDTAKTFVTNAVVVGGTDLSHDVDAGYFYLVNSTTVRSVTTIGTSGSFPSTRVFVVEYY
jgi:hypothetical protein